MGAPKFHDLATQVRPQKKFCGDGSVDHAQCHPSFASRRCRSPSSNEEAEVPRSVTGRLD
jgi:hypothetical protein